MMPIGTLRNVSMSYSPSGEQLDFIKNKTSFVLTTTISTDKRHQKGILKSKSEKTKWNPKIKNIALALGKMSVSFTDKANKSTLTKSENLQLLICLLSLRTFGEMEKRKPATGCFIF